MLFSCKERWGNRWRRQLKCGAGDAQPVPLCRAPCDSTASISAGLFHRMTEGKVEADQRSIYVGNVSKGCRTGPSLLLLA